MQPQSMFAQHYILSFTCAFAYISPPIPSKHCTSHQNFDIMVEKSRPEFGPLSPPECTPPLQAGFDANRPMALIQGQTHPNGCILPPMTSSRHSHSPFTQPPHATPPLSAQPETTTVGDFHGFLKVRFRPLPFLESFNGPQIWIPR